MTTFYENPYYYSNELKRKEIVEETNEFNDFFIDDLISPVSSFCKDSSNWEYAVTQLRQQIFNSTIATYPAPETFFVKKAKHEHHSSHDSLLSITKMKGFHNTMEVTDVLQYRKDRSENVLIRMIHCQNLDLSQVSLMRLSKGVFVHQKWQSSIPQSSPTLSAIEDCLSNKYLDTIVEAPVDTFHFNNVNQMVNHLTSSCYDMFIPYSYTFGARFTNPYDANDLIIRGKIPLWCQTLFLSVCMKRTEPIEQNVPIHGLFPFAPHVPVTFKSLAEYDEYTICPELTMLYEKFTMEHIDPFDVPESVEDAYLDLWPSKRQEIKQNILVCDLSDEFSKLLSDMATVWAASQGLIL